MTRLIDADAFKIIKVKTKVNGKTVFAEMMQKVLDTAPTVDAVPVIRCKDCKYAKKIYIKNLPWVKQWEYTCAYFNTHSVMGDGFCSYAEPKERGR